MAGIHEGESCKDCVHYGCMTCDYPLPWWADKLISRYARYVDDDQAGDCELYEHR